MKNATNKKAVTVKNAGTVVVIAGKSFVMPPVSLGAMERSGTLIAQLIEGKLAPAQLGIVPELVTEALARNYDRIDRDEIANSIDLGSMQELMAALMTSDPTKLVRELEADNAATPA